MTSIFKLTEEQMKLKSLVDRGELTEDEIKDTLDGLQDEFDEKVNNYCHVLNHLAMQLEAIKTEKDRYAKLQKEKENEIKRVKAALAYGLQALDKQSFDTGNFKGHMRKGGKSVNIINADNIPPEFVETVITEKPNKAAIKKALEAGEAVTGAEIVIGESTVIIK